MPRSRLWLDIETYSSVDLKATNVYRYVASPDFQILMCAWSLDGSPVQVAIGREEIDAIPGLRDPEVIKVAHNAQFERVCFSAHDGLPVGQYLEPEHWHDTMSVAGELGYPKKLEKLAVALGASPKDSAGTLLINWFCKPDRKGNRRMPEDHIDKWLDFIAYCHQDVVSLIEVDEKLGDFPTEMERQLYFEDQRINDRGIRIDIPMARMAVRAGTKNQVLQIAEQKDITELENPNSIPQLSGWLKEQGLKFPNLRAETVEKLVKDPSLTDDVRTVLKLRQELALAAPKKFGAALATVLPDERLRGTLAFFGAHTGRWAGRGTQIQNLPRLSFTWEDPETGKKDWDAIGEKTAILELLMGEDTPATTLKKLVRPMFLGPFTVVDYSAIEARVIAWLSGEQWAMDAFNLGRDIYVETAERMGGLTRAQGKIAVLALGYNGAANSLKAMAEEGDRIHGMSDDELLEQYVYPWRDANPQIVRLWKLLDLKYRTGGDAGPVLSFEKHGRDRLLRLPSGRPICYRSAGKENYTDKYGRKRQRLTFKSPQGYRTSTYGGKLTENATQAVARDIMAEALIRLRKEGYNVVGHVHDEILVEGEHDVDVISEIMCELPDWAEGLPIGGEGFVTTRYRKG